MTTAQAAVFWFFAPIAFCSLIMLVCFTIAHISDVREEMRLTRERNERMSRRRFI